LGECKFGLVPTKGRIATVPSSRARKFASIVLLSLLCSYTLSFSSGCGNDEQGGGQGVSGFSDETVRRLDGAIAKQMREDDLPGVVLGVWVPGEDRYVVARGKANLKTGEKRDLDDPFRIGSITKTFVATAVLQLIEEGKLSKSDKLSEWYPDFPNAEKITVDDLLRMQSGIVDPPWEDIIGDLTSPKETIEASANLGGAFLPPGQRTEYTNVNYVILGEIVSKVSGKDTGDQITKSILKPLGMRDTVYPTDSTLPGDLRGYTLDPSTGELKDVTSFDPSAEDGAGAMISNVSDLKTWAEAVCTGKLLETETQKARLQTKPLSGESGPLQYGEGIMRVGEFCGHSGRQPGFSSAMWYLPQKDATIIVSVNREDPYDPSSPSDDLGVAVVKIVFPKYLER
jgi:D-alanyl-D-alanine carboxypeptidase